MNFKQYLPYLSGICFSSIFGFSFLFTKEGLEVINPFQLLGFRFGFAALAMTLLWLMGIIQMKLNNKPLRTLLTMSAVMPGMYFVFEVTGINLTTSSEAGLIISLIPVVVTILGYFFLNEKPKRIQWFFIILSVAGVAFIVLLKGFEDVNKNYLGMLVLGGAVISGGIYNILSRKLSLDFKPVEITFIMVWFGTILFNILALLQPEVNISNFFNPLFDWKMLTSVLYLGILSSVVAFFMMNFTLSKIPASQSAVFANLTTVVSILAGVFFRNEPFYWFQIIGAFMIVFGVWGTNYFGRRKEVVPS